MSAERVPTEAWRASIVARQRAIDRMLDIAVADLTREQVNHVERAGVLPIAFSLLHAVGSQDRSASRHLADGAPTLWDDGRWAERTGVASALPFRGAPMADAEQVRIGDLDAWRAYQTAVFARTERLLVTAPLEVFARVAFGGERTELGEHSFLGLFIAEGPIRVMDVCEAYLFQHACRHLGEIEHARALVGLGGIS